MRRNVHLMYPDIQASTPMVSFFTPEAPTAKAMMQAADSNSALMVRLALLVTPTEECLLYDDIEISERKFENEQLSDSDDNNMDGQSECGVNAAVRLVCVYIYICSYVMFTNYHTST